MFIKSYCIKSDVYLPFELQFFDTKTNTPTLSGFMVTLNGETTFPAVLNSLSDAALEAHALQILLSKLRKYWEG